MKLEKVLDRLNSLEKNAFLKIVDNIITSNPSNLKAIDAIVSEKEKGIKSADSIIISRVFSLIEREFTVLVKDELSTITSQLDIIIDIIIRDGFAVVSRDWFNKLYEREVKILKERLAEFNNILEGKNKDFDPARLRDYKIYSNCIKTAYSNDRLNNQESKITIDEQSILLTLSKHLELSLEEIKLINYTILPFKKLEIDDVINYLRNIGIIFFSKKNHLIYVPDEIKTILRKIREKDVADKYLRRILNLIKEPQINNICRRHNIDLKLSREEKTTKILKAGISIFNILGNDIFRDNVSLTDRKNFINDLVNNGLNITPNLKGVTLEDKIQNLIQYFIELERDEKIGITLDGYNTLLLDMSDHFKNLVSIIKSTFDFEPDKIINAETLLESGIKPIDIIDLIGEPELQNYCKEKNIKTRGNLVFNILDAFKDTENILLENYANIGFRDFNALKDNGIVIKESELGVKFEELTKCIFTRLGFAVDEDLRKKLNTRKDIVDIVLNLGNNDVIIIECKTKKESGYNNFSAVSRQIKSYFSLANSNGLKVVKSLLIAPEFSDDFIADCELEYELNLSLITASSLISILKGLEKSKHEKLPFNLLMRDVLIKEDRILKALEK